MTFTRRAFTASLLFTTPLALMARPVRAQALTRWPADFAARCQRIEAAADGRLGVSVLDTATGATAGYRAAERFPICSTFKVLAAGAILSRVDAGAERLSRRVFFTAADLVANSPITQTHVQSGMTLAELCAAAVDYSDNTAGNMLLAQIGGPAGLTAFARSIEDPETRLDRTETTLNEALAGDPRDTTTPEAMRADLAALALGPVLSPASRQHLVAWLTSNTTGGSRLRRGFPAEWRVGDKTGTGDNGSANDIAVAWPPNRAPVLVAVYLTGTPVSPDRRNQAIADVGRLVASGLPATP